MVPDLEGYALIFRSTHRLFHRALEGLTDEQALELPEGGGNPMLWIAAHMVTIRAQYLRGLGETPDVPWMEYFPRGGERRDMDQWPQLAEVRACWDEVHAAFMARIKTLDAGELAAPSALPGLEKTLLGALGLAALHDCYHVGQLAMLRRLHGLERLVG